MVAFSTNKMFSVHSIRTILFLLLFCVVIMVANGSPTARSEKHHHKNHKNHHVKNKVVASLDRSEKHHPKHHKNNLEKGEIITNELPEDRSEKHHPKESKHGHKTGKTNHHGHEHRHGNAMDEKEWREFLEKNGIKEDDLMKQAALKATMQDGTSNLRTTGLALKLPPKCKFGWKLDPKRICRPTW